MNNKDLANAIYSIAAELKETVPRVIKETVEQFTPKENARISNEETRQTNEDARQTNEKTRNDNEETRKKNEKNRMELIGNISDALTYLDGILSGQASILTYPKGSVYISFEDTSPSNLFGGSWEKLENGRFLMTGEDTGLTGGSDKHIHSISGTACWSCENDGNGGSTMMWIEELLFEPQTVNRCLRQMAINEFEPSDVYRTKGVSVGGTSNYAAHLPPYITVHMWRRIA